MFYIVCACEAPCAHPLQQACPPSLYFSLSALQSMKSDQRQKEAWHKLEQQIFFFFLAEMKRQDGIKRRLCDAPISWNQWAALGREQHFKIRAGKVDVF